MKLGHKQAQFLKLGLRHGGISKLEIGKLYPKEKEQIVEQFLFWKIIIPINNNSYQTTPDGELELKYYELHQNKIKQKLLSTNNLNKET